MARVIEFTLSVEVDDAMGSEEFSAILSDLEEALAKQGLALDDSHWEEI